MFLGTTEIDKAYLGNALVFSSGPTMFTFYPSSYDETNSVYKAWTLPASNAYDSVSSTNNEARATLINGANAETKVYWQFDLSSIPSGATIKSIEVKIKTRISQASAAQVQSYYAVVCNGTTEVGTRQSLASAGSGTTYTLDAGTGWTRDSIQNLTILELAKRGTVNTGYTFFIACDGADLTITYEL